MVENENNPVRESHPADETSAKSVGEGGCPSCNDHPMGEPLPTNPNVLVGPYTPPTTEELELTRQFYARRQANSETGARSASEGMYASDRLPRETPLPVQQQAATAETPMRPGDLYDGMRLPDTSGLMIDPKGPAAISKRLASSPAEAPPSESTPTSEAIRRAPSGEDVLLPSQLTAPWIGPITSASTLPSGHFQPTLLRLLLPLYLSLGSEDVTTPMLPGFHINPGLLRLLLEYYLPRAEWDSGRRAKGPSDWRSEPPANQRCDEFEHSYLSQIWVPLGEQFVKTVKDREVTVPDHRIEDNKSPTAISKEDTTAGIIEAELNGALQQGGDSPDKTAEDEADESQDIVNEWVAKANRLPAGVLEGLKGSTPWGRLVNALREALRRWPAVTLDEDPCSDENCDFPEVCFGQIRIDYFRLLELRWQWDVQNVRRKQIAFKGGQTVLTVDYDLYVRWWARVEVEFLFRCICIDPRNDPPPPEDGTGTEPADDPDLPAPIPVPGPGEKPGKEPGKPGKKPLPVPPT